jgi:hypothetical protein
MSNKGVVCETAGLCFCDCDKVFGESLILVNMLYIRLPLLGAHYIASYVCTSAKDLAPIVQEAGRASGSV